MQRRPKVVAFDVIETLFSLDPMKQRFKAIGLPEETLGVWFARLLRDAMALEITGVFRGFREIAGTSLEGVMAENRMQSSKEKVEHVLEGFRQLPAHPDVQPALQLLRDEGVRVVTLTNGSAQTTQQLLKRAALEDFVEESISIDEVKHWKPAREVYLHAAKRTGVSPGELALVAAHGWDIQGAARAGLVTGYISRKDGPFPSIMEQPDVQGNRLEEVIRALLNISSA